MFKRSLFSLLVFLFVALSLGETYAQKVQPNRWFVNVNGGVSIFYGDVKRYDYIPDHESPSEIQPMFSANFGKEISKIFSVRGQFLYGQLSGHKKASHYNFRSDVMGGHLLADINLYYLFTGARFGDTRFNIYASLGAGYLSWDTKLYMDTPPAEGTDFLAQSKMGALSFPASLSFDYAFTKNLSISVEGMLYTVTSDEVDAKSGGISIDMVNYNSIGLTYKFYNKKKHRRSKVNYALDPEIYEPKESDIKEVAKVEVVPELEKEDIVEDAVVADIEQPEEAEYIAEKPEVSEKFPINHELEKAAIQKEIWASKTNNPWPEIKFSVQIIATKGAMDTESLKEQFDIPEAIYEKYDGEWYRYSVGEYDKVWRAKELRNALRSKTGIKDAFIVVYRNEERISLAEALNYVARNQNGVGEESHTVEHQTQDRAAEKVYPMIQLVNNIPPQGITIGVQVLSIQNDRYPLGVFPGIYGIEKPVLIYEKQPWYKLIVTDFETYEQAYDFQYIVRDKGFIDAFVVAFKDGKRISIRTLKEELKK